ncbi:MAG: NUDIX hydrolase [Myxococcota bacterium]|nr:NUDIX hydrolase [Myxococcota bacterium]
MPPAPKPRDAASLLLLKGSGAGASILMGRRPAASSFAPDFFVFPGGKLEAHDHGLPCPFPLSPETERGLRTSTAVSAETARALANAAIRETYEETGLLLARPGRFSSPAHGPWHAFSRRGLAPDHSALGMIGRAITPRKSPVRFHARFLLAHASATVGRLRPNEELLDLAWYPLQDALRLPAIDVTQILLREVLQAVESGLDHAPPRRAFIRYRDEVPMVRYESNLPPGAERNA